MKPKDHLMQIRKIVLTILFSFSLFTSHAQLWHNNFYLPNPSTPAYTYDPVNGGLLVTHTINQPVMLLVRFDTNGDTLWTQQINLGYLYFMTESVIKLSGGDYVISAYGSDMLDTHFNVIFKYSSSGILLSQVTEMLPYDFIMYKGSHLLAGDNNEFYLAYSKDTAYSDMTPLFYGTFSSVVKKFDANNNIIWQNSLEYDCGGMITSWYSGTGFAPDALGAFPGGGLVVVKNYDTLLTLSGDFGNAVLERWDPNGATLWEVDIHDLLSIPAYIRITGHSTVVSSDSSILLFCSKWDGNSGNTVDGTVVLKFDANGNLLQQVTTPLTSIIGGGTKVTNGDYLFICDIYDVNTNTHTKGIVRYKSDLTFVSFSPEPFNELIYGPQYLLPNQYGGAFFAFLGTQAFPGTWDHIYAVNFDSLLNVFPAQFPGNLTLDMNANCQVNTGDLPVTVSPVKLTDANNNDFYSFSDNNGQYNADVPLGTYTVSQPVAPNKQVLCPSGGTYSYTFSTPGTYAQSDFYDVYIPNLNDIVLSFYPSTFVPGFNSTIQATVTNVGSVTANSTLSITLPSSMQFNSSVPAPVSNSGGVLTYDVAGLTADSTLNILIDITLDQNTVLGSLVSVYGYASLNNDLTPNNNGDELTSIVVGSFDPNDKASNRPPVCHPDQDIIYKVRFQNTGTYHAKNVVVIDTISDKLDMSTFKLLSAWPMMPEISWSEGNKLTFTFADIYLPDSNTNEPASHGDFIYSIRPKNTVNFNDTILNTAHIYFDFNQAVITNTTMNIIGWPLSVKDAVAKDNILIYPNPATDILTVRSDEYESFEVINTLGQLMLEGKVQQGETKINIKNLPPGIYSIKLLGVKGSGTAKVQKL